MSCYSKEARMEVHRSGFEFGQDGQITIRRNESSCGTPPIRYQNYRDTWRMNADSVLQPLIGFTAIILKMIHGNWFLFQRIVWL